jgi:hypothetical protein
MPFMFIGVRRDATSLAPVPEPKPSALEVGGGPKGSPSGRTTGGNTGAICTGAMKLTADAECKVRTHETFL